MLQLTVSIFCVVNSEEVNDAGREVKSDLGIPLHHCQTMALSMTGAGHTTTEEN